MILKIGGTYLNFFKYVSVYIIKKFVIFCLKNWKKISPKKLHISQLK